MVPYYHRASWPVGRRVTVVLTGALCFLCLYTLIPRSAKGATWRDHRLASSFCCQSSDQDPTAPDQTSAQSPSPTQPSPPPAYASPNTDPVDWSRFAYTQYVTNTDYLCNSVMLFERLHALGAKADFLIMHPSRMQDKSEDGSDDNSTDSRLLKKASEEFGVKLKPVEMLHGGGRDWTWSESYTKLLAFNQTEYDRVLNLDSDSTVLQSMDELFLLPPTPLALPRAYWIHPDQHTSRQLSSQLLLITPSAAEFARIEAAIANSSDNTYDMEIINDLYYDDCMVLPHKQYDLLTGEFKNGPNEHGPYLGEAQTWDPRKVLEQARFLHFSDWPVAKPWMAPGLGMHEVSTYGPKCGEDGCLERDLWVGFYADFEERRRDVCGLGLSGASNFQSVDPAEE